MSGYIDLQDSLTALLYNFSGPKALASYSCNILKTLAKCAAIYIYGMLLDDSLLCFSARLNFYQLHKQFVKIYSKYILP